MGVVVASMILSKKYLLVKVKNKLLQFFNLLEIDGVCIHWKEVVVELLVLQDCEFTTIQNNSLPIF